MHGQFIRFVVRLTVLVFGFLVAGCSSVRNFETSGRVSGRDPQPTTVAVDFAAELGSSMYVTSKTKLSAADEAHLWSEARQMTSVLERGVKQRFADHAARYKLKVISAQGAPENIPKLSIKVVGVSGYCPSGCGATLRVSGHLQGAGRTPWLYWTRVSPPFINTPIDDTIFTAFADELLSHLTKDGVIAKP